MSDWIADGESGSSVRGKLNNLWRPLAGATISSPVDFVEIALPAGYVEFLFKFWGCVSDSAETFSDSFTYQLSFDGGMTYETDGYECITNMIVSGGLVVDPAQLTTVQGDGVVGGRINRFFDTEELAYVSNNPQVSKPFYAEMSLFPGSSYEHPRSISRDIGLTRSYSGSTDYRFQEGTDSSLLTMTARANKIKLGYYFGDGLQWAQGSYAMYGVPSP